MKSHLNVSIRVTLPKLRHLQNEKILLKVCTIVYLLEGLLEDVPPEKKSGDLMEQFFVFSLTWAFGGPMVVDKSDDYRRCG